jgi:hypothetical protein
LIATGHGSESGSAPDPVECTDLVIAAREHQAHGVSPGVIVKAAIRIRIDETVQVEMPAEGAEEVVAFEVGFALVAFDETTGSTRADPLEQSFHRVL